ncbi:hypothetical protein PFISCL1PPCAC_15305, partial [Pristionchus fissidentatus]
AAAAAAAVNQPAQHVDSSPRGSSRVSSARGESVRAASAASTLTLTPSMGGAAAAATNSTESSNVPSLFTTAARACARSLPFCALEESYNHAMLYRYTFPHGEIGERLRAMPPLEGSHTIPDKIFLAITWWCFPESEDDIRLYSCLANGGVDEFNRGELVYTSGGVESVMQIGYHLSAKVSQSPNISLLSPSLGDFHDEISRREGEGMKSGLKKDVHAPTYDVSIGIDRCRIVSCECSCTARAWCQHMVALCLFRLHQRHKVEFRVTIWDSINELGTSQLKKFAQYLVNDLPRQYLPTAQKLIDGLTDPTSTIYHSEGAPDPTDGGHEIVALWSIDQQLLHERVARTLYRFCQPSPTVHCDVQFLSSTPPAIASEWQLLLQPLKTKKPEGIWNLVSIVRAMFKRRDENATALLHVITDEILASTHMLIWWLVASLQQSGRWAHSSDRKSNPLMTNYEVPQLCAAALCDEMVSLWRVAALNPALTPEERRQLAGFIQLYHKTAVERLWLLIDSMGFKGGKNMESHSNIISLLIATTVNGDRASLSTATARFSLECFPGFYPALQACHLCWNPSDLGILPPEVTFSLFDSSSSPHLPQITGGLRRPYTVSSTCPQNSSMFYGGYGVVDSCTNKKKKSKNKKKSSKSGTSSKKSARHQLLDAFERFELDELESAESGQESDMPGPSSRSTVKRRNRRSGSNYPSEDVDMLFAAAHQPLDGMDLKLARCEALFAHGHTAAAAVKAAEIVVGLRGMLPRLVWDYDRHLETMTDPSPSSSSLSIPIPPPKQHKQLMQRAPPHGGIHPSQYYNTTPHHLAYPKKRYGKVVAIPDAAAATPPTPVQLPDLRVHSVSQLACSVVQRALLLAKQLLPYPIHRHSVFRLLVDVLEAPKGAMSTNSLQVKLFHLESEVRSILNSMPLDSAELEVIRSRAISLARWDLSPSGKSEIAKRGVPPVSLAAFIFTSLVTRDNILLHEEDSHLGVAACLAVIGARHSYPEGAFPMLGECLRRQKGEIALGLFRRFKDDSAKLGLVLDRLLDSTQHRMYSYHKSNGAHFLERDPIYRPILLKGEKPTMNALIGNLLMRKMGGEKKEEEDKIEEEEKTGLSPRRPSLQQSIGSWESGGQGIDRGGEGERAERSSIDDSEESGGNNEDRSSISTRRSSDEGNESSSNSLSQSGSAFPQSTVSRGRNGGTLYAHGRGFNGIANVGDGTRFNNKKVRPSPPFEAHAHYMFELAKRILTEAGGDQSSTVFRHAPNNHGPHRKLHMSAFLTGLYALGLSNKASGSWASRTYSNLVCWTTAQALDIGAPAIDVIRDTWFDHLTPPEAASLGDKAGQSRDQSSQDSGAHLALSVLHHCHALSREEGQRALDQCRLQGPAFMERAVNAVDDVSRKEGVFPEILFSAARSWANIQLDTDPSNCIGTGMYSTGPSFNGGGGPPMAQNPYYYAAIGFMQQQQQNAAVAAVYGGGSAPPPMSSFNPSHPPPMVRQPSRSGDDDAASQSSASSSASGAAPSQRPSAMHTSHSAPNLGPGQVGATSAPPSGVPTAYDPRMERLTKAQHLGLRAMETAASRGTEDRSYQKYSARPPFYEHVEWLFELSYSIGPMAIEYFCDRCSKTINSPRLLASFVHKLLKLFPNVHHGSIVMAAPPTRQLPFGMGQGKFRSAALSAGWKKPTADVFDRTMEMAYSAISHKFTNAGSRVMSVGDVDEVMDVLQCIQNLLMTQLPNQIGWPLLRELFSYTSKQKSSSETQKLIAARIHSMCSM